MMVTVAARVSVAVDAGGGVTDAVGSVTGVIVGDGAVGTARDAHLASHKPNPMSKSRLYTSPPCKIKERESGFLPTM